MGFRKLITTLLAIGLLTGLTATALATEVTQNTSVTIRGISVAVNGKVIPTENEPFIYENRTYVPLRAIGEALRQDVSWDGATNRVVINGRVNLVRPMRGG